MFGLFKIKSVAGILLVFMMLGCGKYTEPNIKKANVGFLILEEDMPFDNGYGVESNIYIDGKSISSIKKTRILIGKHNLSMDVTAFYNRRAKYAEIKNVPINILDKYTYKIKIISDKEYFNEVTGNTHLNIIIEENKKTIIKKRIILKDNRAKTIDKYPDLQSQISTIITAVIL